MGNDMPAIGFTDKFRRLGREYLLQTSVNELKKAIICSLFQSGQLISSRTSPIPDQVEGNGVIDQVSHFHEQCYKDIDGLLGLAENMKDVDKPELIEKIGKTLCARELYDEARELLGIAVEKHPQFPGLHFVLGRVLLSKGQFEEAGEQLSRAAQLAPTYPDYRNLLGIAYLKLKRSVAAIDEFKKAVELNIYYDEAYYNLGLGFILNGIVKEDYNLAKNLLHNCQEAFQKAALFNPGYLNADYQAGMDLLVEGKLEQAYDCLSRSAKDAVSHVSEERLLEMYLRYIHGSNGMTEEGIKQYVEQIEELLKVNPGHADLHNELGMAYTIMCKFMNNKAIGHFKEALRLNSNFQKASKNLKLSQNDLKGFEVLLEAIVK
jgi:tetratricopeptide (TPR) repeat protein